MTLPIVRLEGSPYEQGLQHGRELQDRIAHNLDVYFARFTSEGRISHAEVLHRANRYLDVINAKSNSYFESLRGISEGSGFDIEKLAALNVRYEILYHQFTELALVDGCTAFAIAPERTANGHTWIGENWDWIPQVKGALLHIIEDDTDIACFTEAGIVGGKIGLNSHGLGLAINGLMSTEDDWARLQTPFHARCYEILRQRDLPSAIKIVTGSDRSCSANYLLAHVREGIVNVESAPFKVREIRPFQGFVSHTNHFVDTNSMGIEEPPSGKRPFSEERLSRSNELLSGDAPVTPELIQRVLADEVGFPYSICRQIDQNEPPSEHYQTVTSVMMDLDDRAIWISDGPPNTNPYQEFRLGS